MRFWSAAALLLATGVYVLVHPPVNLAAGRDVLVACPVVIGDWNGTELSFEDAVVEELRADDLLIRRYERGDEVVWLCVVYHRNRRYGAHDPRLCYESQGYVLDPERRVSVEGALPPLIVNRFVADRARDRRVVYYWWSTPGLATPDDADFRRRLALGGALEGRSGGAFVRVESLVRGGDETRAERAAQDFAARVAGVLPALLDAAAPRPQAQAAR